MDKIVLSLNKDLDAERIDYIVSLLNDYFHVLEDDNEFELLRYVTIDAHLVDIKFTDYDVCLCDKLKLHNFVRIPNKFVFEVKVKL